jgi:HSP20 family protein
MQIKDLIPWNRKESAVAPTARDEHPVAGLQREMNRVFESFWNRFQQSLDGLDGRLGLGTPRADVAETGEAIEVSVELPGLDAKDIDVSLTGDMLTIKGERRSEREEKHKGYYLSERSYGSFSRAIPLPPGVATDNAKAEFKKGVLTVSLPKTPEAQAKVKKIEVRST